MKHPILFIFILLAFTACTEVVPVYMDTNTMVPGDIATQDAITDTLSGDIAGTKDTSVVNDTGFQVQDTALADISNPTDSATPGDILPSDSASPADTQAVDTAPETTWYWLGTSEITDKGGNTGTLIVSHNALALFPLDLSETIQNVETLSAATLVEIQTLGLCGGNAQELNTQPGKVEATDNGHLKLLAGHQILTNLGNVGIIPMKNIASVHQIELEMPYFVPQDDNKRVPTTFCYGYRKGGQWYVNLEPIAAVQNEVEQKALGTVVDTIEGVDSLFLLFDSTVAINWIRYKVSQP